jgi:hypothetical protein
MVWGEWQSKHASKTASSKPPGIISRRPGAGNYLAIGEREQKEEECGTCKAKATFFLSGLVLLLISLIHFTTNVAHCLPYTR